MRFSNPLALIFLLTLPFFIWLGWPAHLRKRSREFIALSIRLLIILLIVIALAGIEISEFGQDPPLAVVFVLDISDSMPAEAISSAQGFIRQSVDRMDTNDRFGLIVFGQEAFVDVPVSVERQIGPITSIPKTNRTNLAQAINLGIALFPPSSAKRLIILSDGAVNDGRTEAALQFAVSSGVDVQIRPVLTESEKEVILYRLDAPPRLRVGDQFDLELTIQSSEAVSTQIQVFEADRLVYDGNENLRKGEQSFRLPVIAHEVGFTEYQIKINPSQDTYYQNNSLSTYTQISGPPQVLIVAPPEGERLSDSNRPDEFSPLVNVLDAAGYGVETIPPISMPSEISLLAKYASIVLVDVPARQLTNSQMIGLKSYVKDLGGGLVVVGGPTSYGVGGYFRTPLEEILPVEMQIKDEQRRPSLAMIFIIDHSGSMAETSGGPSKLDLAKEAVVRATELLSPNDQVGVIVFDDAASWAFPVDFLEDGVEVRNRVSSIGIGGGTDILAGIQALAAAAPTIDAGATHVILLTDGGANPTGIPELVRKLNEEQAITLSAIGVGSDAAPFLAQIAEVGGGRYHLAANPSSIPNIFTEETTLATRAYIIEEPFIPSIAAPSAILNGIEEIPPLYGYIGTTSKQTAQTVLVSHESDPILATWRYGLGKTVAFTSDATGRWAKDWLQTDSFPVFWTQVVQSTLNENIPDRLNIRVIEEDSKTILSVDTGFSGTFNTERSTYLNDYLMSAYIVQPDGTPIQISLNQTAPGYYESEFTPSEEGIYLINVTGDSAEPGQPSVGETTGWALDYSPEYRLLNSDLDRFVRLALQAGTVIAEEDPAAVFLNDIPAPGVFRPLWPFLLAFAAILLPVDIGFRRVVLTRADLTGVWKWLSQIVQKPFIRSRSLPPRTETLSGLFKAKQSARQQFDQEREDRSISSQQTQSPASEIYQADQYSQPSRSKLTAEDPSETSKVDPSAPESGEVQQSSSITELLALKRSRQSRDDRES